MATIQTSPPVTERPARTPGPASPPAQTPAPAEAPARLVSLDAYRGFIMLLMASGGLAFAQVATRLDRATVAASTVGLVGSAAGQGPLGAVGALVPDRSEQLPPSRLWDFL